MPPRVAVSADEAPLDYSEISIFINKLHDKQINHGVTNEK
jgi:hypothetical protein